MTTRINTDKATTALGTIIFALMLTSEIATMVGHSQAGVPVEWQEYALVIATVGRLLIDILTNKTSFAIGASQT